MTACSTAKSGYCTYHAAAYTSAPVCHIMDTAIKVVSILIAGMFLVLSA